MPPEGRANHGIHGARGKQIQYRQGIDAAVAIFKGNQPAISSLIEFLFRVFRMVSLPGGVAGFTRVRFARSHTLTQSSAPLRPSKRKDTAAHNPSLSGEKL